MSKTKTISTARIVPFSPEEIFHAFEDPTLLAKWWGPDGFTNTFEEFKFRPGGKWSLVMHGPNNQDYANEWFFRTIESDMIVIDHLTDHRFSLTIKISPRDEGTHISWTQEFEDAEVAEQLRPVCEPANEENLDRLEEILSEGKSF